MSRLKDPHLLVLFMNGKRPKEAARIAGVHPSTAYRRLAEPDFKAQLKILTDTVVRSSANTLTSAGRRAARRLIKLLDEPNKPSIQLAAAKAILHSGEKLRGELDAKEPASLKQARLLHQTFGTSPPAIATPYPPDDDKDDREPARDEWEESAKHRQDVVESMREDAIRANVRLRGDLKQLLEQIEKEEREALEKARPRSIFKGAAEQGLEPRATEQGPAGGSAAFSAAPTKTERSSRGPSGFGALGVVLACVLSAVVAAALQRGAQARPMAGVEPTPAAFLALGGVSAMGDLPSPAARATEASSGQRGYAATESSIPSLHADAGPPALEPVRDVREHGTQGSHGSERSDRTGSRRLSACTSDSPGVALSARRKTAAGSGFSAPKPSQIYAKLLTATGAAG